MMFCRFLCCCRKGKKSKSEKLMKKAQNKLNSDLDIVRLIDTIYKIKATLKVVVARDSKLVTKIMKIYNDDKLVASRPMQTEYATFLEEDELFELKRPLAELRLKK